MRRFIRTLLFLLAVGAMFFSATQLWGYYRETGAGQAVAQELFETAVQSVSTPEPVVTAETARPAEPMETPEAAGNPWAEYAPFTVDFEALKAESEDIVAWIYCKDTPINYPIVQGADNAFYLERLPDGTWNGTGSLFLDYTNESDFSEFHSIVYGHNMLNNSMFGVLTDYYQQEYYDGHPVMYLMTPEQYYKVELIGGIVVHADSEMYNMDFTDPQRKERFVTEFAEKSTFQPVADFSAEDRYLTLSTCTYDYENARYLLTGKLVPVGGA